MLSAVSIDLDSTDTGVPIPTDFETSFTEDQATPVNVTSANVEIDAGSVAVPTDVIDDDFTTGIDPGTWSTVGTVFAVNDPPLGHSGPEAVRLNPAGNLISNPIDLTGATDVSVEYTFRNATGVGMISSDKLVVEYRNSGGGWTLIEGHSPIGTAVYNLNVANLADADHANFQLSFRSDAFGSPTKAWFVDDVKVTATIGGGSGDIDGATVTLDAYDAGTETIAFTIPVGSGISLDSDLVVGGNRVLTFSGSSSPDDYENLFESFTYSTTEQDPAVVGPREFTFIVNPSTADEASAVSTVNLVAVNDDPSNVGFTLDATTIDENGVVELNGSFDDPESGDVHTVTINWGDGSTDDVLVLPTGDRTFQITHQYLDDSVPAASGFEVNVSVDDGTTSVAAATQFVSVNNVAPTLTPLVLSDTEIDENGSVSLSGSFTEVGTLDRHVVRIDWGDGTVEDITLAAGVTNFNGSHQYLDDPASLTNDVYTITVSVADNAHQPIPHEFVASTTADVTVNNVDPVIDDGSVVTTPAGGYLLPGDSFSISGTFSDVGTQDDHLVTIDWGDGSDDTTLETGNTFSGTHTFTNAGIFDVVVTVDDQDGGVDTFTTRVLVTGIDLNDGALQIVGDDTRNQILVLKVGGEYRVYSDLDAVRTFDATPGVVTHIEILTGGDRDHIVVSSHVDIPVIANAGDGNDVVIGGSGNDVISGGAGDDHLFGRSGEDILLGGDGNDKLFGGKDTDLLVGGEDSDYVFGQNGEDLLIGGTTVFDDDAATVQPPEDIELVAILDAWVDGVETDGTPPADSPLLDESTVLDDGELDLLFGGGGDDTAWLFDDLFIDSKQDDPDDPTA